MKKSTLLALAVILAGFAVLSLAKPRFSPSSEPQVEAVDANSKTVAKASNLSGEWVLDPSRSDMPKMWGGNRPEGHSWGEGHSGNHEGQMGSHGQMGARGGRMRLPRHIEVTQNGSLVSFADSTGTVLQQIAFDSHAPAAASDVVRRTGQWKGNALEVQRERGGATFTESWSLQDSGTLVCTTRIQGGEMGDRTMKRVYRRVEATQS